jgi:hypothetical protein
VKRVVTGVDDQGRSVVLTNEEFSELSPWVIQCNPRSHVMGWIEDIDRRGAAEFDDVIPPIAGGVNFHHMVFEPGLLKVEGVDKPLIDSDGFHTTRTIEFVAILSGEVKLLLDQESVVLEAGDFLIQQATRHAWINESQAPTVAAFVMLRPEYVV